MGQAVPAKQNLPTSTVIQVLLKEENQRGKYDA
uniref:Uncharacterized protein n=1 Tax=Rhizophora mucronata TaxID=61149 RepID=A0A2P2PJ60_RHIMU